MEKEENEKYQKFKCLITINGLQGLEHKDCQYHVEWKRGRHNGSTEQCICDADNHVEIQNSINLESRLEFDRKGNPKTKKIKFEAFMTDNLEPKDKIGTLTIDLADYVNQPPVHDKVFDMEGKKKKKSKIQIVLTIALVKGRKASDSSELSTDGSITEPSPVVPDETDPSPLEVKKEKSKDKKEKSKHRHHRHHRDSVKDKKPDASQFATIGIGRRASIQDMMLNSLPTFESSPKGPSQATPNNIDLSLLSNSFFTKKENQSPSKFSTTSFVFDIMINVQQDFDQLLNIKLPQYNATEYDFEGPDSLVFGLFLEYNIFDSQLTEENTFERAFQEIAPNLLLCPLFKTDDRRQFLCNYGLLSMMTFPPAEYDLSRDRLDRFAKSLQVATKNSLSRFTKASIPRFKSFYMQVFAQDLDYENAIQIFKTEFDKFNAATNIPKQAVPIIVDAMIKALDAALVDSLSRKPQSCCFMKSIELKTFCTMFQQETSYELSLLNEAVTLIQMASTVLADPKCVSEVCPHLAPTVIAKIILSHQIDESFTTRPEQAEVLKMFNVDKITTEDEMLKKLEFGSLIFKRMQDVNTELWKNIYIPGEIRDQFLYVTKVFPEACARRC